MPSWPDLRIDEYSLQKCQVNFRMQTVWGKCENIADPDQTPHCTWIGTNIVRNLKMNLAIEKM